MIVHFWLFLNFFDVCIIYKYIFQFPNTSVFLVTIFVLISNLILLL